MLEQQIPDLPLTADERSTCLKLAHALQLRNATLQGVEASLNDAASSASSSQRLTLDEVRALQPLLADLFDRPTGGAFPIALRQFSGSSALSLEKKTSSRGPEVFIAHDDRLEKEERGSLLPRQDNSKREHIDSSANIAAAHALCLSVCCFCVLQPR